MFDQLTINNDGTIIGLTGKELKGELTRKGYIRIKYGSKKYRRCVLVAQKFLNWFDGCEVHHKNKVRTDDRVENLEVLTPFQHRLRHEKLKIIGRINNGCIDRVYNSVSDAEMDNGFLHNHSHIHQVLNGVIDKCGGYGWIDLDYSDFLPYFANESASYEDRMACFALIYKALLSRVRNPLFPQNDEGQSKTALETVFKGFHFK